ncbi:STAS domain-containing protein [Umezawaea endophytica]|uniref:Anti-sigma factor antagonist n=1 Tax=Umezawaea endophytica TaxID=1654476 RepID=A0A9X2VKS5_9PSEU|nr:STAS domain-containing protein [Umezawaea endophytica]MCS7478461.1 STAS domain-containing protein [Umezawaea endophytica]
MEMLLCVDTTTTAAGAAVVSATGEVDYSTAALLGERVRQAHRPPAAPRAVVVDLSGVEFLSAAGVGVLVVEHHRSRSSGVPMLVVAPNRSVRRTLAACDALSVLHVLTRSPATCAVRLAEALDAIAAVRPPPTAQRFDGRRAFAGRAFQATTARSAVAGGEQPVRRTRHA